MMIMMMMRMITNPLNPYSDQLVISPYSHTAESFIKIMRIKEMPTQEALIVHQILLVSTKGKCMEKSVENMDTDVRF